MEKDDTDSSAGRAATPPKRKRKRPAAAAAAASVAADEDSQEQRAEAKACADATSAATVVHWAEAFPVVQVKKVLQDHEPEIGGLLQPATRLITACSALFVRNLVHQCNTTSSTATPKLEALRRAVAAEPLLEGVLDGLEEGDYNQSSGSLLTSAEWKQSSRSKVKKPAASAAAAAAADRKKQKQQKTNKESATKAAKNAAAGDGGLVEEALKIAGDSNAGVGIIPMKKRQEVVFDEEDYD